MENILYAKSLADQAVQALIDEVSLTPKPGLVDQQDSGSHKDLTYSMMVGSANSLHETFYEMAILAMNKKPSRELREQFGVIGRAGEQKMLQFTNGVNTHKGAIWTIGLLVASAAMNVNEKFSTTNIFNGVAELSSIEDTQVIEEVTNGKAAIIKYGGTGAKAEAQNGLPHIKNISLPLYMKKLTNKEEKEAKFYALISLIATLNDTCILHRGGKEGLMFVQNCAKLLLTQNNIVEQDLFILNKQFMDRNLSPGGSADLFAATLFIHSLITSYSKVNLQTITC